MRVRFATFQFFTFFGGAMPTILSSPSGVSFGYWAPGKHQRGAALR